MDSNPEVQEEQQGAKKIDSIALAHYEWVKRLREFRRIFGLGAMVVIAGTSYQSTAEGQEGNQETMSPEERLAIQREAKILPKMNDPEIWEEIERIAKERGYIDANEKITKENWLLMYQWYAIGAQMALEKEKNSSPAPETTPTKETKVHQEPLGPPAPSIPSETEAAQPESTSALSVEDPQIIALQQQLSRAEATIAEFKKDEKEAEITGGMSSEEKVTRLILILGLIAATGMVTGTVMASIKNNQIVGIKRVSQLALVEQAKACQKKIEDELEKLGKDASEMLKAKLAMAKADLAIAQRKAEESQGALATLTAEKAELQQNIDNTNRLLEVALKQLEEAPHNTDRETLGLGDDDALQAYAQRAESALPTTEPEITKS